MWIVCKQALQIELQARQSTRDWMSNRAGESPVLRSPLACCLSGTFLLISQNWDPAGRLLWIRNWKSALVDQGPLQETRFPHKDFENLFLLPNTISVEQCRNYIKHDVTILQGKGFLKPFFNNDTNIIRFDKKPVHIILDRQTWLWPRAQIFFSNTYAALPRLQTKCSQ